MNALERRAVSTLALLYSFRMLGLFMVLPLLALYAPELKGATPSLIGLALGIYGLSQALLQIPFGWLSDRLGRKPVIIGGLLLFALGSLVAALADSVQGVIIGRALQGAGAIASTVMALVADLTREEQRTKAMAIVGASIGLAFTLALILGPLVASFGGLSAVFYLTVMLALLGIAVVLFLIPTPSSQSQGQAEVGPRTNLLGRSLRDPGLLRLNGGVFVLHFTLMAAFLVIPALLQDGMAIQRESHWLVYLAVVLLSLLGVLPLMRIAERGGRPRESFACGIILLALSLVLLAWLPSGWWIAVGLWLFFIGFNYLEATLPSLVSKTVFSGGKGTALGVYSTCQFLGTFIGGAAGGAIIEVWGATALLLVCLLLMLTWLFLALPTFAVVASKTSEAELPQS
ncbi:MFS transporter [Parahaliea sp. F7430]|uniref:MFS transporter n=1 Tax=Sediminihaliea albiluteola TaxID=2758564 RepID=A0A7W2TY76_9GAMM|nr:MFS transporter [Sediminihaliea albiluteola]MBA6414145.1 MFS transporter [Sediminihaliea albiluteola]